MTLRHRVEFLRSSGNRSCRDFYHNASLSAFCCVGAGLLLFAPQALAQNWEFGPLFEIGILYDDNPRLFDDELASDDSAGLLNLGLDMRRLTERSAIMFRPQVDIRKYSQDSAADSEDILVNFSATNTGLRSLWRFAADFRREQVLRGEVPATDFDDPRLDDDVTGTVGVREPRERDKLQFRPGATFDLTERMSIALNINYVDVQYDKQELGTAADFSNGGIDLALSRRLSPESSIDFGVFASEYETNSDFNTTAMTGFRARYSHSVSERSTLFFEGGFQDSDIELSNALGSFTEISESGFLLRASWDRRWARTRFRVSADHGQSPSGSGFMVERDQLRAAVDHQLTQRWTLQVSGVALTSETLGLDSVQLAGVDFFEVAAGLRYDLSRKWSLQAKYTFDSRDEDDEINSQESNGLSLSVAYTPEFQQR